MPQRCRAGDIGNTLGKIHGLHMSAGQATTMILDSQQVFKQTAEFDRTEVDVPNGVVDSLEADVVAGAGCRDGDPLRVPSNAPVRAHKSGLEVGRVDERRWRCWQASFRGAVT